jgi:hypothetical protein
MIYDVDFWGLLLVLLIGFPFLCLSLLDLWQLALLLLTQEASHLDQQKDSDS